MKPFLFTCFFFSLLQPINAQDFRADFFQYFKSGDKDKQLQTLKKWEKKSPKDAELYTCYFNYYFSLAREESLTLTTQEPKGQSLSLKDSLGNTAGFIGNEILYDSSNLAKGFQKIDEGIKLYPDRLDMRFGKIYALGETEDWDRFTDEIVNTVRYSAVNKNEWTWTNNEKKSGGKEAFLGSIQDYQLQLFDTQNDSLLKNMRTIALEVLKIYPNHVESLSNLSITYILTGEYDKGIEALKKAENINPHDDIVLSNIAHAYKLKGDKENAILYYQKMLQLKNPKVKEFAQQQIDALKK